MYMRVSTCVYMGLYMCIYMLMYMQVLMCAYASSSDTVHNMYFKCRVSISFSMCMTIYSFHKKLGLRIATNYS